MCVCMCVCVYARLCVRVCACVAVNRASTYHRLSEMEKMFPQGVREHPSLHIKGSQEGGSRRTKQEKGERQHGG